MPCGSPVKDVDEVVKEVEMVHLGRQCERIENSCPFGFLMRTEEERAPSGHGEVAVHPFDEIIVKCSVASLEDVDHSLPFVVEVAGGLGQLAVGQQVRLFQYFIELVLYLCQYGGGVLLSPFEVVLHRPTVFSYLRS